MSDRTSSETKGETHPRGEISLLCSDPHCDARWAGHQENMDLFVCACVSEGDARSAVSLQVNEWSRDIQDRINKGELVVRGGKSPISEDDPDSVNNIRTVMCWEMKCLVRYGRGVHIHCESCCGSVLRYLRG